MRHKTFASAVILLACALVAPATAAPVILIDSGTLTASLFLSPGSTLYDVRGIAAFSVYDPAFLGAIAITDPVDGTDPGFLTLPFGNAQLYGLDLPTPTEVTSIVASLASAVPTAGGLVMYGFGTPLSPAVTSVPALQRTLGPLRFDFAFAGFTPAGPGEFLVTYNLSAINSVPEPAAVWLVPLGLVFLRFASRWRR